uniref:ATP synthase protein 8 n=1 Tax=Pediculus schaeffi TaxID=240286 RepID=M4W6S9_PEDSC|nr:ATP synthase protein 8 [Pediculus schaeffi]
MPQLSPSLWVIYFMMIMLTVYMTLSITYFINPLSKSLSLLSSFSSKSFSHLSVSSVFSKSEKNVH